MANTLGLAMGGPTVIGHGTEEQKERYLAPILSADEIWCQGFSEPQSGSDLASLKTKAVRKGDEWIVTGQKVWTTMAHQAKWCMLLARTDPDAAKHRGLTYFLMDMEQDGVEIRPLRQITGEAEFNELFIEEARIPDENIVGGENSGWSVAITTLMHERAGLAFALQVGVQIALRELLDRARENGVADDPVMRQRFAQIYAEAQVLRLTAYRGLTKLQAHGAPGPEGSLGKWHWAEVNQSLTELAMDLAGPRAQLVDDPWTYRYLRARANSIEGGTTEILKNIVAERVLGLPRSDNELRPLRGPAGHQAHRAGVPRRALQARGGPAARFGGGARVHRRAVGRDRRARVARAGGPRIRPRHRRARRGVRGARLRVRADAAAVDLGRGAAARRRRRGRPARGQARHARPVGRGHRWHARPLLARRGPARGQDRGAGRRLRRRDRGHRGRRAALRRRRRRRRDRAGRDARHDPPARAGDARRAGRRGADRRPPTRSRAPGTRSRS